MEPHETRCNMSIDLISYAMGKAAATNSGGSNAAYSSLEQVAPYLYNVTFDSLPQERDSDIYSSDNDHIINILYEAVKQANDNDARIAPKKDSDVKVKKARKSNRI